MSVAPEGPRVAVIIDDDPDIRELVELVLAQSGFETVTAANGMDGVEAVREHQPLVTTLDVSMPGMDGFATARRIRELSDTYILMLTALNEEIDVVEGLGAGADDYLVKPFRTRELRARVEAVLRRPRRGVESLDHDGQAPIAQPLAVAPSAAVAAVEPAPAEAPIEAPAAARTELPTESQAAQNASPESEPETAALPNGQAVGATAATEGVELIHNGVRLNRATRIVELDGRSLSLTRSEFDLLATVLESGRRVRSKADLVLELRGESYVTDYYVTDADKRTIEVHMANLRRKLGDSSTTPRYVETVRGVGYRAALAD